MRAKNTCVAHHPAVAALSGAVITAVLFIAAIAILNSYREAKAIPAGWKRIPLQGISYKDFAWTTDAVVLQNGTLVLSLDGGQRQLVVKPEGRDKDHFTTRILSLVSPLTSTCPPSGLAPLNNSDVLAASGREVFLVSTERLSSETFATVSDLFIQRLARSPNGRIFGLVNQFLGRDDTNIKLFEIDAKGIENEVRLQKPDNIFGDSHVIDISANNKELMVLIQNEFRMKLAKYALDSLKLQSCETAAYFVGDVWEAQQARILNTPGGTLVYCASRIREIQNGKPEVVLKLGLPDASLVAYDSTNSRIYALVPKDDAFRYLCYRQVQLVVK
jgi:hypothetical protein